MQRAGEERDGVGVGEKGEEKRVREKGERAKKERGEMSVMDGQSQR